MGPSSSTENIGAERTRDVVVRLAGTDDAAALDRLAALDGAHRPRGRVLLAEVDGRPAAALPIEGGRAVADPFVPTAGLVDLLRLRAAQLAGLNENSARTRRPPRGTHLAVPGRPA